MIIMLIDLTDYETKKLELEIKGYEKAILEEKGRIGNLQYNKLHHELKLIEQGITKEDVENHLIEFVESSDNIQEDLIKLHEELDELLKSDEDVVIEDLNKILHYSTISITIINLEIEESKEEIKLLRDKKIQLQKQLINRLNADRKYKELLKNE